MDFCFHAAAISFLVATEFRSKNQGPTMLIADFDSYWYLVSVVLESGGGC